MKPKLLIVTTIPLSLFFFKGQISYLKKVFHVELLSSSGPLLNEICSNESVTGHIVNMKREISILKDLISVWKMFVVIRRIQPDIVLGNTPKGSLLSLFASWLLKVPNRVYYVHGLRYDGSNGTLRILLKQMEKFTCFFATEIIAVSRGIKTKLQNEGITKKKINILLNGSVNGIDSDWFSLESIKEQTNIRNQLQILEEIFVFGFVGRIVGDKGINELVQSFTKLQNQYSKIHLILVGPVDNKTNPVSQWTKDQIENNQNITHFDFQKDIRPYLKAMNVFALPSYREGFGVSLLEALSLEIPCISSDITGCNEIIINGVNGLLVKPKDANELYLKMKEIMLDKNLYCELKINSRNSVLKRYDQQKVWEESLKFYSSLI